MKSSIKYVVLALLPLLLIMSVIADPIVTTNSTSDITTSGAAISCTINESASGVLYVGKTDFVGSWIHTEAASNGTTFSFDVDELEGDTLYYWKVNGTNVVGSYNCYNSFTTLERKISGSARTIINLFTLLAFAGGVVFVILPMINGGMDIKKVLIAMASLLIGVLILNNFIIAVTGI